MNPPYHKLLEKGLGFCDVKTLKMFSPLQDDEEEAGGTGPSSAQASGGEDGGSCSARLLARLGLPRETFALVNAAAVAVATILGTGILALPVKLAHSGMAPFSVMFLLCLLMQLATVILMVELLQRTHIELDPAAEKAGGRRSSLDDAWSADIVPVDSAEADKTEEADSS